MVFDYNQINCINNILFIYVRVNIVKGSTMLV
jgi:hypothetical protein